MQNTINKCLKAYIQQDEASGQTTCKNTELLHFLRQVISGNGDKKQPLSSSDLIPLDYLWWAHDKTPAIAQLKNTTPT